MEWTEDKWCISEFLDRNLSADLGAEKIGDWTIRGLHLIEQEFADAALATAPMNGKTIAGHEHGHTKRNALDMAPMRVADEQVSPAPCQKCLSLTRHRASVVPLPHRELVVPHLLRQLGHRAC